MARPTKYNPKYCAELIDHMAHGLSFEAFAGRIGVSKQTLYDWEKAQPEFLDAKEVGLQKAQLYWERLGIRYVVNKSDSESTVGMGGSSKSRSLNASVWIFNMKNRFGWRDKQPGEVDVVVNNIASKSDEDLDNRIRELMAKQNGGKKDE